MIPSIALRALDVLGIDARVRLVEGTQYTNLLRKHKLAALVPRPRHNLVRYQLNDARESLILILPCAPCVAVPCGLSLTSLACRSASLQSLTIYRNAMPQRLKLKEHQQLPYLTVLRKMWFILPILQVRFLCHHHNRSLVQPSVKG